MKYNIKHKITAIGLMFAMLLCFGSAAGQQTKKQAAKKATISFIVKNAKGEVIPDAKVVVGEGVLHLNSDENGLVEFTADIRDVVTVDKDGYSKNTMLVDALIDARSVTLTKAVFMASADDQIPLPFSFINKRYSVGSSVVITGEELERYASGDIRNALTGLVSGLEVIENNGSPGMTPQEKIGRYGASDRVTLRSRGKVLMYMLDDVPIDIAETPLDPRQIESITIVKDILDKTLYGPFAANGIVYIKTKRGKFNDRILNVNMEAGVSVVDRMPEFVNGTDYALLNNIARKNSNLGMLYTKEDVAKYAKNDPYDMLYPNVDFRNMILKNTMKYQRANVSAGGGNDVLRYFTYLGYSGEGDVYKIGSDANYNRINISSNLDIKLNHFIKARFGLVSTVSYRKSANYGYSSNYSSEDGASNTTLDVSEFSSVINDINRIPAISFPIYANNDPELESPWYAVSQNYSQNPFANMLENGSYTETVRKGLINVGVDMDFSFLLKGLTSTTYGAFDATNMVRLGTAEDYDAYLITKGFDFDANEIPILTKSGSHSVKDMANKTKLADYLSQRFFGYQKFTYTGSFGLHDVDASLMAFMTKRSSKFITEPRREVTTTFAGRYAYNDKYLFQTAMSYSGTYSLQNNRYSFSPSVGIGWIVSQEKFMSDVKFIDFLKVKAQGGILHYDGSMSANRDIDNYSWNNGGQAFGPHANNQWFGSTVSGGTIRVNPSLLGNANLRLERRKEFSAGVEAVAFNRRLSFELNYFNVLTDGPVAQLDNIIPLVVGTSNARPWMNYERYRHSGYELAVQYRDRVGDFSYSVGVNATAQASKMLKADEMSYIYPYQSAVGYSVNAIRGFIYEGQFKSDAETLEVPQLFDSELHAGDMKYKDMNGDGVIDDNDRCVIGNSSPKLFYALNVYLRYKSFDLYLVGTGRAFYDVQLTNGYFWNGWGDGNYSKYTKDNQRNPRHPKLTYDKVNNNFKMSNYWIADGSYFKIQNVEVGWNMPLKQSKSVKKLRVYVSGVNLLTFSKIKDVDPESMNSGLTDYPLFRTFVAGIKLTF